MTHRKNRCILIAGVIVFARVALAQTSPTLGFAAVTPDYTWQVAQAASSPKGKLVIVTLEEPDRRRTCRIRSFTSDKIVCSRAIGGPRTYPRQKIAALILPGDGALKLRLVIGINLAMGAAIWGTVVLAPACPACAAGTGILALLLFSAAGAILIGDDQPDRLLYLTPGHKLSAKLGYVQG